MLGTMHPHSPQLIHTHTHTDSHIRITGPSRSLKSSFERLRIRARKYDQLGAIRAAAGEIISQRPRSRKSRCSSRMYAHTWYTYVRRTGTRSNLYLDNRRYIFRWCKSREAGAVDCIDGEVMGDSVGLLKRETTRAGYRDCSRVEF